MFQRKRSLAKAFLLLSPEHRTNSSGRKCSNRAGEGCVDRHILHLAANQGSHGSNDEVVEPTPKVDTLVLLEESWKKLQRPVMKFSQRTSPYPDIPSELKVGQEALKDARRCLAVLVALEFIHGTGDYFRVARTRETIARMAEKFNGEGAWKHVLDYLQNVPSFQIADSLSFVLRIYGSNAYYGNFLDLLIRIFEDIEVVESYHIWKPWELPALRQPRRKRGYDDKGSRRLPHTDHGISPRLPYGEPEKIHIRIREPRRHQWFQSFR